MASQVAHIIYARKYFEKYHPDFDERDFILGCVFPDIRRIDPNIKRKTTHPIFYNLNLDFEDLSSFEAGWKFHLYCDMRREEVLNNCNFYSQKYAGSFENQSAKMLEDEIVYDSFQKWSSIYDYFKNVSMVSTGIDIPKESFEKWYSIVADYIKEKPNDNSIKFFLSKQPSVKLVSDDIVAMVDKLRKNDKVVKMLEKVKDEIV
jgi:hypothetical protein